MKNVLLLAHDDQGQESRLQAALDVTRAIEGHLTCLDVVSLPRVYADALAGPAVAALLDDERTREDANCDTLKDRLGREDVAWDLRQVTSDVMPAIRDVAEMADLVVLSSRFEGYSAHDPQRIAADAAIGSDRLVLAVPDGCRGVDFSGTALIAWNGSREAAEVLRSAAPLFQLAREVVLFAAGAPDDEVHSVSEAARYLSRHDVHCRIVSRMAAGPIADAILRAARETGAAYIAMGAFGHSRMREALFGGVSRSMLEASDLPLLLAH